MRNDDAENAMDDFDLDESEEEEMMDQINLEQEA